MSKILLHNFPSQLTNAEFNFQINCPKCGKTKCKHQVDLIIGFQQFELQQRKKEIVNDFINALLLNDQIFIYSYDIFFLIDCFKISELRKLVEKDILKIIYADLGSAYLTGIRNNLNFDFGSYESFEKYIGGVENKLIKKSHNQSLNQAENDFLARVESTPHKIDKQVLIDRISSETKNDLKNTNITKPKMIKTKALNSVLNQDAIQVLAIAYSNRALILGGELEIESIHLDNDAKGIMNAKLGPTFFKKIFKGADKIEIFKDINDMKGLPNLGELYLSNIISLDDIFKIRESIDGKVFRIWYDSKEYDKEKTLKHIINSVDSKLSGIISKHIRWIVPVVAGIIEPITGIASSYSNSFIADKFLKGYHPNLFLDNVLRKNILAKQKSHKTKLTTQVIRKRKTKIGRNDPCICGSGKKYKRCCINK